MYSSEIKEEFFQLVRLGIGTSKDVKLPDDIDWLQLKAHADEQGLTALVLDGLDRFQEFQDSSTSEATKQSAKVLETSGTSEYSSKQESLALELKLEWIGEVLQDYEQRYELYKKAISSLAGFYNKSGYKMMVLKGFACSLDWPKPNHRPTGDIDIWQFGQQKEADLALKEKGIDIDNSHHHHTVFNWRDFTIENHYDFINVHHHKSHFALEKTFKELGADNSYFVKLNGEKVYLPSPNLHALFLLKHAALHFVGTELTFRQVLDWAFFVKKHRNDVDWDWLHDVIEEHGLMPFYQIMNLICIDDLGFDTNLFPKSQYLPEVKERVVNEIFAAVYQGGESKNFLTRQVDRLSRWKANQWKHKLCYKESMWSAFWCGFWGHLLKPSSI